MMALLFSIACLFMSERVHLLQLYPDLLLPNNTTLLTWIYSSTLHMVICKVIKL